MKHVATNIITPKGLDPFLSHGKMLEDGKADMYNACEWGNYCRVEETSKASRQVGRRAIITYAAIVVGPKSSIYTPQQLANVPVGVPFYFGTHYVALHLLGGFLPREMVKLCSASPSSYQRLQALVAGDVQAVTLTEPHISLAEKLGCRIICSSFYHGTEVASDRVDAETYAAFNRAVREAVQTDQRQQVGLYAPLHRLPREAWRDRRRLAQGVGSARKPPRGDRSRADPGRRACNAPPSG